MIGEQNDKALEILERLEKVDPSNPDTYYLYANVYAAKQRATVAQNRALGQRANATTNAARKRAMIDSSAALSKQEQALLKQALDMQNKAQDMPVKVTFNEFTPAEGKVTLGGTIANRTDAPKSYTLKVEFLDKAGTVVSTGEAAVGPVEPQRTGQFSIVGTGAGIVAFRYAPIH